MDKTVFFFRVENDASGRCARYATLDTTLVVPGIKCDILDRFGYVYGRNLDTLYDGERLYITAVFR